MFFPTIRKVGKKLHELSKDLVFLQNEYHKVAENCTKGIASLQFERNLALAGEESSARFAAALDAVANPVPKK